MVAGFYHWPPMITGINVYEQTESERLSTLLKVTQLCATSGIWTPYDSTAPQKYKFIKYKS